MLSLYAAIEKIDRERRLVFGYASTEAVDQQGEIVRREALEAALPAYMRFANIREMHQPSAVGIAQEAQVDDRGLWLGAKVVDDAAWEKVKEGVYKGFSIGGRVTARAPQDHRVITGVDLTEISLVDRPANPEATFAMFKHADGGLRPQPRPFWNCGRPRHQHASEREAITCMEQQMSVRPRTDLSETGDRVVKGMEAVACLAGMLEQIRWLQQSVAWEAMLEGDDSDVPALVQSWLAEGVQILRQTVAEESEELLDGADVEAVVGAADGPIVAQSVAAGHPWPNAIAAALRDAAVAKSIDAAKAARRRSLAEALEKMGARNSKADLARLQKIHDHTIALGAACNGAGAGLGKRGSEAAVTAEALGKISDAISPLLAEVERLQKRLAIVEAVPLPPKGVLGILRLSKEDDRAAAPDDLETRLATLPTGPERADELLRHAYYTPGVTPR